MIEITKWEYIDLKSYIASKQDPSRFLEMDRDPEGYNKKSKTEILNELGKLGWELVGMDITGSNIIYTNFYLKRPCGRLKMIEKVNGQEINPE